MTNTLLKSVSLAGLGFCLLAGVFSVSGDSAPAAIRADAEVQTSAGNTETSAADVAGNTFDQTTRTFDQTFRQHFDLRDIAVDAANGASLGDSIADFRRNAQLRLLQTIDGELAAYSQKVLREYRDLRKTEVDFQTPVGGRKVHIGVNLIGAISERPDSALGWQLRAYGADEDSIGFNSGVFYRKIIQEDSGMLIGGNIFADYEKHDYGEFVRYSLGGELQNRHFSFAANWYVPVSDEKDVRQVDGGGKQVAFSQGGYDAQLRITAPRYHQIKAAVDYYHFDGEHGLTNDNGFRFGGEWHPAPDLRLVLFYDKGAKELGGELTYSWTIGEVAKGRASGDDVYVPDLFAAVRREHSQRIALATVSNSPFDFPGNIINITVPAVAIIGTIKGLPEGESVAISVIPPSVPAAANAATGGNIAKAATLITPVEGFQTAAAANGDIIIRFTATRQTPAGLLTASVRVSSAVGSFTMNIVHPAGASYAQNGAAFSVGTTHTIGMLNILPGFFDNNAYSVSLSEGASHNNGAIILTANTPGQTVVGITVGGLIDGAPSSLYVFAHTLLVLRAGEPRFTPSAITVVTARISATVGMLLTMAGYFDGPLSVVLPQGAVIENGNIIFAAPARGEHVLRISVTGTPPSLNRAFTLSVLALGAAAALDIVNYWVDREDRNLNGVRFVIGSVYVTNPGAGVSYSYSLIAQGGGGNGSGRTDSGIDCSMGSNCRFWINTSTGELTYLDNIDRQLFGTIVVTGTDLMATVIATVQRLGIRNECSYDNCPRVGITRHNVPTQTQISILHRAGLSVNAIVPLSNSDRGSLLVPFLSSNYNQTQVSVMWDYMLSLGIGAVINQTYSHNAEGGAGEYRNETALDIANVRNTSGAYNWFTGTATNPLPATALQRCLYHCRIGQTQLPLTRSGNMISGGLCVRNVDSEFQHTNVPADCTTNP